MRRARPPVLRQSPTARSGTAQCVRGAGRAGGVRRAGWWQCRAVDAVRAGPAGRRSAAAVPRDRGARRRRDRAAPGRPLRRHDARPAARQAGRGVRRRTDPGHGDVGGPCGADQGGGRFPRPRRAHPLDHDRGGRGPPCDGGADRRPSGAGDRCVGRTGPAVRGVGGAGAAGAPGPPQPLPRSRGAASGRRVGLLPRLRRTVTGQPRHGLAYAGRTAGPGRRRPRRPAAPGRRHHDGGRPVGQRGPGMPYLLRRVRPRLAVELGEELVRRVLVDNPARAFAVEWPDSAAH